MNKSSRRNLTLSLILASSLTACSWMDLATSLVKPSPGVSVDAELTVGDKSETIATEVTGKTETITNTAENINITNVDKNPGFFWSLLFFLGWLLPGPPIPWKRLWQRMKP